MKELKPKKVCKICNDELPSNKQKLCDRKECFDIYYDKKEFGPDDIVTCLVCNKVMGSKLFPHLKVHQLNKKSYIDLYPGAICESPNYLKSLSEKMKGEKNIAFNHGGKNSPFSTKYIKYENLSEEERDQASKEISKKTQKTTKDNDNYTTSVSYYQKQGMTEDEAKEALSERQTTFTIAKCIEKYGQEKGLEVWNTRQKKWLKSYKKSNFSKISQKLFWDIMPMLPDISNIFFAQLNENKELDESGINHEYRLSLNSKTILPDFINIVEKKIIEFDGDYWHGKVGNVKREEERDISLLQTGYKVLHIKEYEYKKNKQETLQKCLNFLMT